MASPTDQILLPRGYELLALEEVDSSSEHAKRIAIDWFAAPHNGPLWIWAKRQTGGRGRRGRSWDSGSENLTATLLMKPNFPVETAAQLSFVSAISLAETLERFVDADQISLKWPNDVLLEERKVAGILLESSTGQGESADWLSIGFGVNLTSFPADTPYPATSLAANLQTDAPNDVPGPGVVLSALAERLDWWMNLWRGQGFEPIRSAWLSRAKGIGDLIVARLVQEEVEGTFVSLNSDGALIIRLQSGQERLISAGEVYFP